jgi:hypothetical protein
MSGLAGLNKSMVNLGMTNGVMVAQKPTMEAKSGMQGTGDSAGGRYDGPNGVGAAGTGPQESEWLTINF